MVFAAGEIFDPAILVITGLILTGLSGVPGLFLKKGAAVGQKLTTALAVFGALCGLTGASVTLASGGIETFSINWSLPFGPCEIGIDPLAALFLLPIFLLSGCCAVYANGYWPAAKHPATSRTLGFFLGLLASSMALLIIARNSVFFLMAWEIMALSAYFAFTVENEQPEVRKAGMLYLVCTHAGTMALFVMFILLRNMTGSFQLAPAAALSPLAPGAAVIFFAAIFGFGMKAGLMPLHIWLPAAHANGPSHVSAMMSGVMLKMGIYGIVRVISLFSPLPLWWGIVLLGLGIVSGVAGIACAIGQNDVKRLLAYSSIENIGIITMGIGVACIGQSVGNQPLVLLGMGGALLHILNHSLFKSLLFLGSGALIHAAGSRELNLMGGLARLMPGTALLFLTGAVAICGLPPLNGFVSEYLIYFGIFSGIKAAAAPIVLCLVLAAIALALIGSLALSCFVKLFGVAFLGLPRSAAAGQAHEASRLMLAPMGLLGLCCLAVGLLPQFAAKLVQPAVIAVFPSLVASGSSIASTAPLHWLGAVGAGLLIAAAFLAAGYQRRLKAAPRAAAPTWGCGYLQPSARVQYSATSFAATLVHLFRGVLQPRYALAKPTGMFPVAARFSSRIPETVLESVVLPFLRVTGILFSFLRRVQHGEPSLYVLYIFITLALLLAWAH